MFRRLCVPVILCFVLCLVGCGDHRRELTEAELSEFGNAVYQLDTARLTHQLAQLLAADTSHIMADHVVRRRYGEVARFEDAPLWFNRLGVSADADSLLACLRREVPRCGLDTAAFFLPQIAADLGVVRQQAFDSLGIDINELLPRLDYNLSRAFVRYTTGQRFGFMRPEKIFNHLHFKAHGDGYARLFDEDPKAPDYEASLQQLMTSERMDYLYRSQPTSPQFQALQQRLAATSDLAECRTLAVNMERLRWQMKRPDERRYILVNIPSQQLWAVSPDTIMNMRICCGTTLTKTPLLHSAISTIQVNPDWIIPQSIVKNEIARHGGDSAYFARHRYYIVNRSSGDTLRAASVSSAQLESGRLRVGQHGGAGNSLGRIVFRFPNDFAVYLHDTNNPSAFSRERRTLSHGCIRVEHPFNLALFLMPDADEWTVDRLRLSIDKKPETDRGRDYLREHPNARRPLRLLSSYSVSPAVPVYIVYYTAYPNPVTGAVELFPDLYDYDKVIARELYALP